MSRYDEYPVYNEMFEETRRLNNEAMEEEIVRILEEETNSSERFLGDVFDIDEFVNRWGKKIFLIAGVGAGKSTWVKNVLANKGSVLFVTSRKAKVDEDEANSKFENRLNVNDRLRRYHSLVTNAKLAKYVHDLCLDPKNEDNALVDKLIDRYDYIVIDEVHSIATDSTFSDSSFGVQAFMEYAVEKGKTVVAMTGTPQPVDYYFRSKGWACIDLRKKCNYVKPLRIDKIIKNKVLKKVASETEADRKVIYFVNSTSQIPDLCKDLTKFDPKRQDSILHPKDVAVIISKSRDEELHDQLKEMFGKDGEQIIKTSVDTYKNIIENQLIPDKCKVLISTSTLREGVDIFNENVTVICDNHILSNIIQFCGRTRLSKSIFYVVTDRGQHRVEMSQLLYDYACKDEMKSANDYAQNTLNGIVSEELIDHVERNPYLRFNYIRNTFQVDHMKYKEQNRVKKCHDTWEEDLKNYCIEYGIQSFFMSSTEKKKWIIKGLDNLAKSERKIFDKGEQEGICQYLYSLMGWEKLYVQKGKVNEQIEKYGYCIESKVEKSGENRDKTYWKFVKLEKTSNTKLKK